MPKTCSSFFLTMFNFLFTLKRLMINTGKKKACSGKKNFRLYRWTPYFEDFSFWGKYFWYFVKFHPYYKYGQNMPKTCSSFFVTMFNFLFTLKRLMNNTGKKKVCSGKKNFRLYRWTPYFEDFSFWAKYFWYFVKFRPYYKYGQNMPKTCSSFFVTMFNFLFTL